MAQKTDTDESKSEVKELRDVLPHTKYCINYKDKKELVNGVHYIVNHLFPLNNKEYKPDTPVSESNYTLSVIQGGITNLLYLLTPNPSIKKEESKSDDQNAHKLLVRIYGENTEVLIERDREEKLFYELGTLQFGPKLFGIFGNGRLEQWYDNAHTLKLHERKHCKKVCQTLANMHSIHPSLLIQERSQSSLWTTMSKWYNIASNVEFKDNETKQTKYAELDWNNIPKQLEIMQYLLPSPKNENKSDKLFEYIVQQQSDDRKSIVAEQLNGDINKIAFDFMFDSVFTHADLLGGNILYLEDTQEIKFIDFEYGAYNFRAFDFANHFCEYAGFDCDWKKHFPNREHIKEFVNSYVETLCVNEMYRKNVSAKVMDLFSKKKENSKDYDSFLECCCDVIVPFTCVDHYFWGLWGVVQARHSPIDFDFIQYAHDRLVSGYQFSLTLLPDYLKAAVVHNNIK